MNRYPNPHPEFRTQYHYVLIPSFLYDLIRVSRFNALGSQAFVLMVVLVLGGWLINVHSD